MRKLTLAASAALALASAIATPAMAAPIWNNGNQIRRDISQLDNRIDRAVQNRALSRNEAQRLQRNVDQLQRLYSVYSRNGLSRSEIQTLQVRIDRVRQQLRQERNDWNNHRR